MPEEASLGGNELDPELGIERSILNNAFQITVLAYGCIHNTPGEPTDGNGSARLNNFATG